MIVPKYRASKAGIRFLGALFAAAGLCSASFAARAGDARLPAEYSHLDPDHDGSIDLAEARQAAQARFDRLDLNHDGKLDKTEAQTARLHRKSFSNADADGSATLDRDEYLRLVEKRFADADSNHDGKIDASELRKKRGKALRRLIE